MRDPRPLRAFAQEVPTTRLGLTPAPRDAVDVCPWCESMLAAVGAIACPNPACPIRGLDLDEA